MRKLFMGLVIAGALMMTACTFPWNVPDGPENPTQVTDPTGTTEVPTQAPTQAPTTPADPQLAAFDALFGDRNSWYHMALTCAFDTPSRLNLYHLFYNGFDGESYQLTDVEYAELQDRLGTEIRHDIKRLPVDKMNAVLTQYFGITLQDVDSSGLQGLIYLESTNCYYHPANDVLTVENFKVTAVNIQEDGTIQLNYTADEDNAGYVAVLRIHEDGYRILSNKLTEESRMARLQLLFATNKLFNSALICEYATPAQVNLFQLFYNGFPDESKTPTDAEWAELKDIPGFEIGFELFRLPVWKINEKLEILFGITLEDIENPDLGSFTYLESTDSYYIMHTDTNAVWGIRVTAVSVLEDGTVRMTYTAREEETVYVAVLKPVNGGYQICSNQKA